MGQALYRKYRSRSLDEIVGQSHITDMLKRAIANGNVAHAYLLTGPRGVGKTSIARILAHEINGLPYTDESTHLDIIEIDAASHTSVEDIRDLREKAMIAPTSAAKKIYIIDEVHMLSKSAFNALLKTLEEPPEHVVFILATTDADKLPATIISRVQRFNFRMISPSDAVKHLRMIADIEHIAIDDASLDLVARYGKGSFRDSISLLDQLQSLSDGAITVDLIESTLGLADAATVERLLAAYEQQDLATIVQLLDAAEDRGTPAPVLAEQLIVAIRTLIVDKPYLLPLLDALLDINKSAWPHVKLLTALAAPTASSSPRRAANVIPSEKPVAAQTSSKSVGAPDEKSSAPVHASRAAHALATHQAAAVRVHVPAATESQQKAEPLASVTQHEEAANSKFSDSAESLPFPWDEFLAIIKESSTGTYALLTKCGYDFDGKALTIHAVRSFNKNKIDKSLPKLAETMQQVGISDGTITVLASAQPPKDSKTAAIFDMMGGGEEIPL